MECPLTASAWCAHFSLWVPFLCFSLQARPQMTFAQLGPYSKSPVHGAGSYQPITALFRILKEKQGTALSCLCPPWPQTKGKSGLKEFLLSASALPCPCPARLLTCAPEGSSSVRHSKKTYRRCTLLKEAETASTDSKEDI